MQPVNPMTGLTSLFAQEAGLCASCSRRRRLGAHLCRRSRPGLRVSRSWAEFGAGAGHRCWSGKAPGEPSCGRSRARDRLRTWAGHDRTGPVRRAASPQPLAAGDFCNVFAARKATQMLRHRQRRNARPSTLPRALRISGAKAVKRAGEKLTHPRRSTSSSWKKLNCNR